MHAAFKPVNALPTKLGGVVALQINSVQDDRFKKALLFIDTVAADKVTFLHAEQF